MNKLMKNEKTVYNILLGLTVFTIALILLLCINSFYFTDDYYFILQSNIANIVRSRTIQYTDHYIQ